MNKEEECLKALQHLIKENTELDDFAPIFSEEFLLIFVRGKKYDAERAYKTVFGYINIRKGKYRDWFKTIKPSHFQGVDINPLRVLKHRDHLNRTVAVVQFRNWYPKDIPMDEILKLSVLSIDEFMSFEDAQKHGSVFIFDFAGFNIHHMKSLTPFAANKLLETFWKNTPLVYKAFHVVNEMYLFTMLFRGVIKPILPKKMKERAYFHSSDFQSLHESVSPDILPESLGGNLVEEEAFDEEWMERIFDKENYYETFAKLL